MKTSITREIDDALLYPDDDGEPMSDDTIQFRWICLIVDGLQFLFRDRPDVFVAGNLLWYAQEGMPEVRTAPDAMVVLGRPKGERGSYMQWREGGVPPHVVFEIRSPGDHDPEMERKFWFHNDRGVEEYYFFDLDARTLQGWIRRDGRLEEIDDVGGWTSPRLGIRFEREGPEGLTLHHPDGAPFSTSLEAREEALEERRRKLVERRRAEAEARRAEIERERAEAALGRAEAERLRAERLAARLRELGELVD
jgi:Uma2 family endonuclease